MAILSFFSCSTPSEQTLNSNETSENGIVKIDSTSIEEEIQNIYNHKLDEVKLRNVIWRDLNDFKSHKVYMQTKKFKVLIDQLHNGSYRYASWPKSKTISDEPDLILKNGTVDFQGSSGNHLYTFKNSNYTYTCFINVLGKKDNDAFLKVTENEKVIVDHEATFISPFSKVIDDSVMPIVLNNYQPSNNLYNHYDAQDLGELLYRSVTDGQMHPEGISLNEKLEIISGIDLELGLDEDLITYYNPDLFKWVMLNLTPDPNLSIGNYNGIIQTVGKTYHQKFSQFTRKLMFIYWNLEKKGFEEEAKKYKKAYNEGDIVVEYLTNEYGTSWIGPEDDVHVMPYKYFDIDAELSGFFLRRYMHGTHDDIYDLLEFVLKKYDKYWFETYGLLAKNDFNYNEISPYLVDDVVSFLKKDFKLVDYKYSGTVDKDNEDDLDYDEDLFEEKEYYFDECDGDIAFEIFSFYAGDHVSKYIPTLSNNDWKAIKNGSSLHIKNLLPTGESSWYSNLTMAKDSSGDLSSIHFDNRGMGGGYKMSISRRDKNCTLNYYSLAD